jgi:hypothetical protein
MRFAVTADLLRAVGLMAARIDADGILRLRFTNRTEVWVPVDRDEPSSSSREILPFHGQLYALLTTGAETVQ